MGLGEGRLVGIVLHGGGDLYQSQVLLLGNLCSYMGDFMPAELS